MKFLRSCLLSILGFFILATGGLFYACNAFFKPELRYTAVSPDGKYILAVMATPLLIGMPGQGSDAPAELYLYDAAGRKLDQASVSMVQNVDLRWSSDRLQVAIAQDEIPLPPVHDHNILLFSAAYKGNLPEVERLLLQGNIHFKNHVGQTLLHAAAVGGNRAIAQTFLEKGLAVDAVDQQGQTPLHLAVMEGNGAIVDLLLAKGANREAKDQQGRTALVLAARSSQTDLMKGAMQNCGVKWERDERLKRSDKR
ncbi:MAG: ankyrin repeat domain-containing protein [Oculatellaceae cyanobacterium Prado106]|nr:ankyrin repeat domain-containing protein [Oculatellaceae cyanobacterium Prado106]